MHREQGYIPRNNGSTGRAVLVAAGGLRAFIEHEGRLGTDCGGHRCGLCGFLLAAGGLRALITPCNRTEIKANLSKVSS
jgi:hypothetical protein